MLGANQITSSTMKLSLGRELCKVSGEGHQQIFLYLITIKLLLPMRVKQVRPTSLANEPGPQGRGIVQIETVFRLSINKLPFIYFNNNKTI
jgi:hypothetical protein